MFNRKGEALIEPIEEKHTELLVLKTFEDIRNRPAFREDLDPNQHKIAKLIGDYTFKEKVHCGLHSCHTPHNTGFLAVTEDNLETIVGNVCGRKWGGDDFIYQKRLFNVTISISLFNMLMNCGSASEILSLDNLSRLSTSNTLFGSMKLSSKAFKNVAKAPFCVLMPLKADTPISFREMPSILSISSKLLAFAYDADASNCRLRLSPFN